MKWLLIVFIVRLDASGAIAVPLGREFDTRSECAAEASRLSELPHSEKAVGIAHNPVQYACIRSQ